MSLVWGLWSLSKDLRLFEILSTVVCIVCATLLCTHTYTSWAFSHAGSRGEGEPPILPYTIPYVGHMFQMGDLHGLYERAA